VAWGVVDGGREEGSLHGLPTMGSDRRIRSKGFIGFVLEGGARVLEKFGFICSVNAESHTYVPR
jgi:hypothetical protein